MACPGEALDAAALHVWGAGAASGSNWAGQSGRPNDGEKSATAASTVQFAPQTRNLPEKLEEDLSGFRRFCLQDGGNSPGCGCSHFRRDAIRDTVSIAMIAMVVGRRIPTNTANPTSK